MQEFIIWAIMITVFAFMDIRKKRRKRRANKHQRKQQQTSTNHYTTKPAKPAVKESISNNLIDRYETLMADFFEGVGNTIDTATQKTKESSTKKNLWSRQQESEENHNPFNESANHDYEDSTKDKALQADVKTKKQTSVTEKSITSTKTPVRFNPKQAFFYKELFDKPVGFRKN